MDLHDQLKNLFPGHITEETSKEIKKNDAIWMQDEPIICKYEKRKGKPITILEGYTGSKEISLHGKKCSVKDLLFLILIQTNFYRFVLLFLMPFMTLV